MFSALRRFNEGEGAAADFEDDDEDEDEPPGQYFLQYEQCLIM